MPFSILLYKYMDLYEAKERKNGQKVKTFLWLYLGLISMFGKFVVYYPIIRVNKMRCYTGQHLKKGE